LGISFNERQKAGKTQGVLLQKSPMNQLLLSGYPLNHGESKGFQRVEVQVEA